MAPTLKPTLVLAALAGAASLLASQDDPAPRAPMAWPAGVVLHDTAADGALWSAGGNWKARFDRAGATFLAASGNRGPAPQARFQLAGVAFGATKLVLTESAPVRTGDRVTYARGAVREFFDVRADGIEQQFLFTELPGAGDLVLDVAVDTDLAIEREGEGHVLRGTAGEISYGRALAIDATGARLPLAIEWRAGAFRIMVPAEFVAAATPPLLVDPMIGAPVAVWSTGALALSSTDIAFDASLGRHYATFERTFSSVDHDVYVALLGGQMAWVGLLTIDSTTEYWTEPRIATLEAHDTACVVVERSTNGVAPYSIALRRIVNGTVQTPTFLTPVSGVQYRHPGIGGDASPVGTSKFLVAFERWDNTANNNEIWFGRMDASGSPFTTTFIGSAIGFKRRMSISKTCAPVGAANARWGVLYRVEPYQQSTGALAVSMVDRNGVNHTATQITTSTPNAGSQWAISSGASHAAGLVFLATEIRVNALGRGDLFGHVFTGHGNVTQLATDLPLIADSADHQDPVVDSDGTRFAVACVARLTSSDADLRVRTYAFAGGQIVQQDTAVPSYSLDFDAAPALCWSGAPNAYGLAWVRHTSGADFKLMAQAYLGVGTGTVSQRATGCGPIGIAWSGSPALGDTFTLTLTSGAPLQGFFFGAPVIAQIPGCSGCTQGAGGLVLYGSALPLLIPRNVNLVGLTLAAQGFAVDLAGLPCLGQIALSNTVDFRVR